MLVVPSANNTERFFLKKDSVLKLKERTEVVHIWHLPAQCEI